MSDDRISEEQRIALMMVAMEDLHRATDGILAQMEAAAGVARTASAEIKLAAKGLLSAVDVTMTQAVEDSMKRSFAEIAEPASSALNKAVKPVMEQFSGLEQRTRGLAKAAQETMRWFSFKWMALIAAGFVGMCGLAWVSVWWQRYQVNVLTVQKAALEADIAEMQSNAAELAKKGGRVRTRTCGERLCIVASANQGEGTPALKTKWIDTKTSEPLVIPAGY